MLIPAVNEDLAKHTNACKTANKHKAKNQIKTTKATVSEYNC